MHRLPWFFAFALVAALAASAVPLRAQQTPNPLPPGEGSDIVAQTCSQCHSLSAITQLRESKTAWRHQIYDMIERGAMVSPAEIDVMVDYLGTHFGPGVPFPNASPPSVQLKPGTGEVIVQTRCSLCHSLDRTVAVSRTKAQWSAIVARMVYLGAPLTPDQTKTVLDYLDTHYGT